MLATAGTLGTVTRQPYVKVAKLDGYAYLYDCDTIASIDRFLISECSENMNQTDIAVAYDFIAHLDGLMDRKDLESLDAMFVSMITSGKDCITIQGEISGCQ